MTNEQIKNLAWDIHNLKLSLAGKSDPQTTALANQIDDLIHEIRRLREVANQAIGYLKDYDGESAQRLSVQVDWGPKGPV